MYFHTLPQTISTLSVTLICLYACWRGANVERWGAILTFLAWTTTPLFQSHSRISSLQTGVFWVDLIYLSGLLFLAFKSDRYWPLWAAAFFALEVVMHIAMVVDHKVHARAYFVGMELWSYLSLFALAAGTWLEVPTRYPPSPKPQAS